MRQDPPPAHHSFIVRVWPEGPSGWRGWVQHVNTGDEALVRHWDELLAFIEQRTGRPEATTQKGLK